MVLAGRLDPKAFPLGVKYSKGGISTTNTIVNPVD